MLARQVVSLWAISPSQVFVWNEIVQFLDLTKRKKKLSTTVAKICGQNESSVCETVKKSIKFMPLLLKLQYYAHSAF